MEKEELNKFIIDDEIEKKVDYNVVSSTDEIDSFDFASDKEFDIEKSHELIISLKQKEETDEHKQYVKLQEAKNIIEKDAKNFLNSDFVDSFNKEEENLINMIKRYDPNIDEVRNMTEDQKDKIYDIAQYLFNVYQKKLGLLTFSFPLTAEEVKFIFKVFRDKLEYDQNEVFQLKDLKENYLDKDFNKQDDGTFLTYINVKDLIVFYHLISKYKVKGITQEHYNFLQILTKIGERIKLYNAYNVLIERISSDFQLWGGALSTEGELVGRVVEPINDVSNKPLDDISVVNEETGNVIK